MSEVSQVHYLEGGVTRGEHPDSRFAGKVALTMARHEIQRRNLQRYVSEWPNLNSEFAPELQLVNDQLLEDFGVDADTDAVPITILDPDTYQAAYGIGGLPNGEDEVGRAIYGNVIIKADQTLLKNYGPRWLIGVALHEGARAYREQYPATMVTTETGTKSEKDEDRPEYELKLFDDIGGLLRLEEIINRVPEARIHGSFWEEGVTDAYRVRKMVDLGIEWNESCRLDIGPGPNKAILGYTGPNFGESGVNRKTGRIYIPWKYAAGVAWDESKDEIVYAPYAHGIAGYGVDLLDRHDPGLYDLMLESRKYQRAYGQLKARMENRDWGLFNYLNQLPNTMQAFHAGLMAIEFSLGIANRPVDLF